MEYIKKIDINDPELQEISIYNNGELALFDNLATIRQKAKTAGIQIGVNVAVLVQEGRGRLQVNGQTYEIGRNDLFIGVFDSIIENTLLSVDFKCCGVCMSLPYIERIVPMAHNLWDLKMSLERTPVVNLSPDEARMFLQYYDLLHTKIELPSVVQEKVVGALMVAFIYDMQNVVSRAMPPIEPRTYNSAEALFKRFVQLLETTYPQPRKVGYYAERLYITPKYLSSVCKKVGKKTVTQFIDLYTMKDIEYLMKYTPKSIKEIANELEFPNISFFGKYVKKHFGTSPRELRRRYLEELQSAHTSKS